MVMKALEINCGIFSFAAENVNSEDVGEIKLGWSKQHYDKYFQL